MTSIVTHDSLARRATLARLGTGSVGAAFAARNLMAAAQEDTAADSTPPAHETSAFAPVVRSVALPTGVTLRYAEQGDPDGVPVLLLHGYTDSWHSWELVLPHLPDSVHAFALTQRGHGDADRPDSGYRPRDFAGDVVAFMDAVGLGEAVAAGHSMGSIVVQRFGIDYPDRTRGLVLAGAATTWRTPVPLELWEVVSTLEDPIDPAFVREFQESTLAQPVSPEFVDTIVAESLKVPARVWQAALREGHLDADIADELGAIQAPTLIVWGGQDAIQSRSEQEILVNSIADARLVVYPDAGHALHWEEPERFAADLVAFVEGLAG